jgi:hypothetical protein
MQIGTVANRISLSVDASFWGISPTFCSNWRRTGARLQAASPQLQEFADFLERESQPLYAAYEPECFDITLALLMEASLCSGRTRSRQLRSQNRIQICGSPTIRINGRDISGESHSPQSFALACRMYPGAKAAGVPPLEMMQRAVREARLGEKT